MKIARIWIHAALIIFSLFALLPFLMVLAGSFTDEKEIVTDGLRLIPNTLSIGAYKYIFNDYKSIVDSYKVTLFVTIVGTALSLLVTAALSYVISIRQVKLRNVIAFGVYFPMLFNGGMIPWYILCVNVLGLKNSIWSLIFPMLVNPFYVFLMKTYFGSIPDAIRESGVVDGAGELRIFIRLILPVAMPIMATIGLFYMLNYWNDFYLALFFVDSKDLMPLQYHLYRILSTLNYLASESVVNGGSVQGGNVFLPNESVRLATTVLTIGPIVFVYPFIQKYFIKGIMIGSMKG